MLQTKLVQGLPHAAGLNPKAFRYGASKYISPFMRYHYTSHIEIFYFLN